VDPATYLPIRTIETAPGESVASDRAIRDDYKWLPTTAANLSLLTPAGAVPAGFTEVPNAGAADLRARWEGQRALAFPAHFRCVGSHLA
jgi:hypothetical protein